MRDRRFEPRQAANESVEVRWTEATGADRLCSGVVRDLSRSGASIVLDHPIHVLTPVRVTIRNQELNARVRFCIRAQTGFVLGVELRPDSQGLLQTHRRT